MGMQHVPDTRLVPWNAIGFLLMKFDDGKTYLGSGALIDSTHVLTCSHNLVQNLKKGTGKATAIIFFPGYNSPDAPQAKNGIPATAGFYTNAFRNNDESWDIAVVRLSKPYALDVYFTPSESTSSSPPPGQVTLAGYPGNLPYEMYFDDQEPLSGVSIANHAFAYVHDTEAGNSGSPLFSRTKNSLLQYGVHTGAFPDGTKIGVLITSVTNAFINAAKQANANGAFLVGM